MSSSTTSSTFVSVRVTPSAGRDAVLGWQGEVLRLSVAAPAERGKANEAVIRLLAGALGLPRDRLRIVRGQTARRKMILVEGLGEAQVRAQLDVVR